MARRAKNTLCDGKATIEGRRKLKDQFRLGPYTFKGLCIAPFTSEGM